MSGMQRGALLLMALSGMLWLGLPRVLALGPLLALMISGRWAMPVYGDIMTAFNEDRPAFDRAAAILAAHPELFSDGLQAAAPPLEALRAALTPDEWDILSTALPFRERLQVGRDPNGSIRFIYTVKEADRPDSTLALLCLNGDWRIERGGKAP